MRKVYLGKKVQSVVGDYSEKSVDDFNANTCRLLRFYNGGVTLRDLSEMDIFTYYTLLRNANKMIQDEHTAQREAQRR